MPTTSTGTSCPTDSLQVTSKWSKGPQIMVSFDSQESSEGVTAHVPDGVPRCLVHKGNGYLALPNVKNKQPSSTQLLGL